LNIFQRSQDVNNIVYLNKRKKKDIGANYIAPPGGLQKKPLLKRPYWGYLFEETNVYCEAVHKLNIV